MNKILRVNMESLTVSEEPLKPEYAGLGGRSMTSIIVNAEVPPLCHPLSAENKLVFAPGLLAGTVAPSSSRLSVGGKSPLTGGIKESNSGGTAGKALAVLDIAALVVEGKAKRGKLHVLKIDAQGAQFLSADRLKHKGNYDTVAALHRKHGKNATILSIGPAGEMKLSAATVAVTDPEGRPTRHAGRGGLGAVMGSKGLKAIVLDTAAGHRPKAAGARAFHKAVKRFVTLLEEHGVTGQTLPTYGTNALANVINAVGAYPTNNFSSGQFRGVEKISGETQRARIIARGGMPSHACQRGCTMKCSGLYPDKKGRYLTKKPEYETVWANGANCGISDLDAIAQMDRLYDDIGVDTIETGATIAVAMEGGLAKFGDAKAAIRFLKEIRKGSPLGRILGSGAKLTGQVLGVERVPVVKGQAMPAYDPRAAKGIGVTYATSTMGADHTAGYAIAANVLKVGGFVDPLKPEGQVELSRNLQIATGALDSTGLCLFTAFCVLDRPEALQAICEMIGAERGVEFTVNDFLALGKRVLKAERDFNAGAGFTSADDRLPAFFQSEKLAPHQATFDVPEAELDTVFNF